MLPEKQKINQNQQQKSKFLTVIYPKKLAVINTEQQKAKILLDRESLVSWLFLVGSLMFLFDGLIELTESISIHTVIHIVASVLFTIGSVLFIPTDKN